MKKEKEKNEAVELKNLLQRTQADFANYRRRNEENKSDFIKRANEDLIDQLLPVLDNFSLAARHIPDELTDNSWAVGMKAIEKQFEQILINNGLEMIKTVGESFNPDFHEAIKEDRNKKFPNNVITREELAGYTLNGKLIRPAKVIVNKIKEK